MAGGARKARSREPLHLPLPLFLKLPLPLPQAALTLAMIGPYNALGTIGSMEPAWGTPLECLVQSRLTMGTYFNFEHSSVNNYVRMKTCVRDILCPIMYSCSWFVGETRM